MEQPGCDEAQWVLAAKRGSEEGWRHLVAAHEDWLMRLAWRLTGRRGVAEELVQETFVEAVDGIRRLRDNGAFRAWIRTILMRAVQRYWRRKRTKLASLPPDLPDTRPPAQTASLQELQDAIDRAIANLSPLYREALALAMETDLTSAEAGKLLGCSAEAYRVRVHKARKILREALKDYL